MHDSAALNTTIERSQNIFERLSSSFLSARSLGILALLLILAYVLGRIVATILRRVTTSIGKQADRTENLRQVNRLRRIETLLVLSIAIIRTLFFAVAVYFWWGFIHPFHQPTAIIGASAVIAVVLGGALSPVLRDLASGSVMMAEQWYGVGDHVRIEPFMDVQGVVERVTLRSTRVRGLNGEIIWINNQGIQAVRVTPKGIRTIALELFVTDIDKGNHLIEQANTRLPSGPLMVVSPLTIMTSSKVGSNIWHITAIAETAPGREWLIEQYAITLITEIDGEENSESILLNAPIARYADSEAEQKFARTIHNARKQPAKRRSISQRAVERAKKKSQTKKKTVPKK